MGKWLLVSVAGMGFLLSGHVYADEGILLTFSGNVPIQSYVTGGGFTSIYPDVVVYDTEGMTDPLYPGQIVIPADANFTHLEVKTSLVWDSTAGGIRQTILQLQRGGGSIPVYGRLNAKDPVGLVGQNFVQHGTSAPIPVQAGDRIYIQVLQDSGVTANILAIDSTWIYARGVNLR